jgi:hypothetical protein
MLLAFYAGVRMTMQAYGIKEPPLGENKAIRVLFQVAAAQDDQGGDSSIHYNLAVVRRIVAGLEVAPPSKRTEISAQSIIPAQPTDNPRFSTL